MKKKRRFACAREFIAWELSEHPGRTSHTAIPPFLILVENLMSMLMLVLGTGTLVEQRAFWRAMRRCNFCEASPMS